MSENSFLKYPSLDGILKMISHRKDNLVLLKIRKFQIYCMMLTFIFPFSIILFPLQQYDTKSFVIEKFSHKISVCSQ